MSYIDLAFRPAGVLFANLIFEDCVFESGSSGSIVEVENCSSSRIRGTTQFHHVCFKSNILINGAGLAMQSPSCSELELIDFVFENNTCSGRCGVIMSRRNRLRDIVVHQNKRSDSAISNTTVFYAPPGSDTSVDHMNSSENRCSSLDVVDGSLNMTRSTFIQNSIAAGQDGTSSTSLHLTSATVSIKECRFEQNEAQTGGAIAVSGSNVTFTDSIFNANVATKGGVMVLRDDSMVSIQSCNFSSNTALRSGGILFARSSQLFVQYSFLKKNSANGNGGCFCLDNSSNLEMSFATMTDNQAVFGGVLVIKGEASGNVTHSSFHMNDASTSGGAAFVQASTLSLEKCRLADGSAEYGGGITAVSSNISVLESTASNLSASKEGGFVLVRADSVLRMSDCTCSGNLASFGGCMHVKVNSLGIVTDCQFDKNDASTSGGAAFVRSSTFLVQKCRLADGSAEYGGGITAVSSNISVLESTASNLSAGKEGGFVLVRANTVFRMSDCTCSANLANLGGCMHVKENSLGIITDCQFDKNDASTSGGAAFVRSSALSVQKCRLAGGSATYGGGIHSVSSRVTIWETDAFGQSANEHGGFISAQSGSRVNVTRSSIVATRSRQGGAIFLSGSVFKVNNTRISQCEAESDGGAIMSSDSSRLLCSGCILVENNASRGGAIFLVYNNPQPISLQLDDSTVLNNSAEYGGIHDKSDRR